MSLIIITIFNITLLALQEQDIFRYFIFFSKQQISGGREGEIERES